MSIVSAQSINNQPEVNRINRDFKSQDERFKEKLPKQQDLFFERPQTLTPNKSKEGKSLPCIDVQTIDLIGQSLIGETPDVLQDSLGKCLNVNDIKAIVISLNNFYKNAGYITTRVYIPEQDLSGGTLELKVQPGRISAISYGTGAPADNRLLFAFPVQKGDLLNLRDLEQALENFNAPPSQAGKFSLLPGEKPGESIIHINEGKQQTPLRVSYSYDNNGSTKIGQHNGSIDIGVDNLLNANDSFTFGMTRTLPFNSIGKVTSFNGQYSLPYGYWKLLTRLGYQSYSFPFEGINQEYDLNGYNISFEANLERMIWRGEKSKLSAKAGIKTSKSRNFVDDGEIKSQRQYVNALHSSLSFIHYFDDVTVEALIGYRQGFLGFGAQKPLGRSYQPSFNLAHAQLGLKTSFFENMLNLSTKVSGQWTQDRLPASERLFLGGRDTIRGFREEFLFGDQGMMWNTDIALSLYKSHWFSLALTGGFDFGFIDPTRATKFNDNKIAGFSTGLQISINDYFSVQAAYERAVIQPDHFSRNNHILYVSGNVNIAKATEKLIREMIDN